MDVYYNSPPLPSNAALQCSIHGCSRLLSDESTDDMCDPCRSLHAKKTDASVDVSNWIDVNLERFPSSSDPPPSAATQPAPTTLPIWAQPRLFSTLAAHLAASSAPLSISELANALLMPTTDQHVQPQLLPAQSDSGSAPISSPVASSSAEVLRVGGSSEQPEEQQLDSEPGQMRVCSVRACKQTVPVGYEYKMCPACRVRYQKYGTTKRAKWKVEREKEKDKQTVSTVTEDSELPTVPLQPHPADVIDDTEKQGTPLPIPRPADETTTKGGTSIETEVPASVPERDRMATTAPSQQPSRPSDEHMSTVLPQPLPLMQHRPPPHSTASHSSPPPPSLIHDQAHRPSNPSTTSYLEADPIVNGFSKFRVELFEGESDGRHPEGTVLSAPHVMKLGEPSNTRTDLSVPGPSDSLHRKVELSSSGEDHVKDASGLEPREKPGSCGNMTRPIVPVSLTDGHPVMSESEIQAAPCSPSQGQHDSQSQSPKDGPSARPPSTTPVPAPRSRGRRKPRVKAATTPGPPPEHAGLPPPPPHPHPGYPAPHPYLYPYYPMYFPPYPGAYQYPYFPMPFAAPPPPSPPKTKKKKKPTQVAADVPPTPLPHPHPHPHPHPGSAYPYPPGPSGAWAYPTPLPPPPLPPISNSFSQESKTSASPVDPVPPPQPPQSQSQSPQPPQPQPQPPPPPPPPPPPAAAATPAVYAIPAVPPLQRPSQSHDPSGSTPPIPQQSSYPHPHLSGTQPYSGTPLTTLMPVPFFSATTPSSASASASASAGGTNSSSSSSSRKDKGKDAGPSSSSVKDGVRSELRKEGYHQYHHQQQQQRQQPQPHVQMQFNYYHYGMGTSQSPTTPETHARKKRRKVDPNYREKMEVVPVVRPPLPVSTAENPVVVDSALSTLQRTDSALLEKQPVGAGIGNMDDDDGESSRLTTETLPVRRCSNKRCTRALPSNMDNDSAVIMICKRCKVRFGKRRERMKERFRLVPRRSVCDVLGK